MIELIDTVSLVDEEHGQPVVESTYKKMIGPQMPLGKNGQFTIDASKAGKTIVWSSTLTTFGYNLVMQNSVQSLLGMINSLQIYMHLPAMELKLPGNAQTVFNELVHITSIDVMPEGWVEYFYFWRYDTDESPLVEDNVPQFDRRM